MATAKEIGGKIWNWLGNHSATILSWIGTAGTIAGPVLAVKAVDKSRELIADAQIKKMQEEFAKGEKDYVDLNDCELTRWEKFKVCFPAYIPTIIVEGATIGCIHGSNLINKAEIKKVNAALEKANLTASAAIAAYGCYAESVGQLTDRTTEYAAMKRVDKQIESQRNGEPPWDEVRTFYIEGQPEFFERTMEQVFKAEYEINRLFAGRGYATMNDFYKFLGLPPIPDGDSQGWDDYIGEVYFDYHWIDFNHPSYVTEGGVLVTEIQIPFGPHAMTEEEVEAELDEAICGEPHKTVKFNREDIMDVDKLIRQAERKTEHEIYKD